MNAFEATLLAYYTLRLPAYPGYEKAELKRKLKIAKKRLS